MGLPGVHLGLPVRPLRDEEWPTLQQLVNQERLWGLLGVAVASGALPATDRQAERADARHRLAMNSALELESIAVSVTDAFQSAGVPVRLLKGLAVAHLDEADPSLRCFHDIDLLVPSERLRAAVSVLSAAGYERDLPERRSGFDRRFAKEVTMTGSRGREVDLHRTLAVGGFGLAIDLDDLWSASAPVTLAGRRLCALDADRRLIHACYGAVLGDPAPRLVLLRDIGLLLTGGKVDPVRVLEIARAWRGEAVLAAGIGLAAERFRASNWPLTGWARSFEPTLWARLVLAMYRSQGGSNTKALLSGALAPMDAATRVSYLRGLLRPDQEYALSRRRAGRPIELRTGLRELLGRR